MHGIKRFIREPVLHFLLLGYGLLLAQHLWAEDIRRYFHPEVVRISAQTQQGLSHQWFTETGQQPTAEEQLALLNRHIDEELLYREALRLRLHYGDPVIHLRLIQNIRFIDPDSPATDSELLDQAYQLGMLETDLVVRRRLIQKMQHRIESGSYVTESEVRAHVASQPDAYQLPPRFHFVQLFFSQRENAEKALTELNGNPDSEGNGEPFLLGKEQKFLSSKEIEKRFGSHFSTAISKAPAGQWLGPVISTYGFHLIKIIDIRNARNAEYPEVRSRALAEVYSNRDYAQIRAYLDKLRSRYRIVLEPRAQDSES